METIQIVQQPAVASVVLIVDGEKRILFQHARERCEGYIRGYIDGRDDALFIIDPTVRCLPGDCRKQEWVIEGTHPSPTFSPKEPHFWLGRTSA